LIGPGGDASDLGASERSLVRRLELSPALVGALAARVPRVDVVHTHTVFTFPVAAAALAALGARRPLVIGPAGTLDAACLSQSDARQKRLALAAYVRPSLARAAAVHATSEMEAAELRALVPTARVEVLPPGVQIPSLGQRQARGPRMRVGSLGRLNPIKRLEALIDAAIAIPAIELELVGDGDEAYRATLVERAAPAADRVRFLGQLSPTARDAWLGTLDVAAFPSAHESFGVAVAEAAAAGCALLLSPEIALAPALADAGAARIAALPDFTAALSSLGRDDLPAIGAAARRYAERELSWPVAARRVAALYEDIRR
jgi:glycosyltransferase involved in cell wall biosynthesis